MIPELRGRIAGIADDTPDKLAENVATTAKHAAPRTPLERDLAAIWQESLELEQVGIGEDFFDIGGHSLSAMRIVVRIRSVLNMEVPVACLFQNPTIETLAMAIDEMRTSIRNDEDVLRLLEEIEAMPASNAEGK
jgi:acyl carrier protein